MERIIEHIERLLLQHDCVIIPDFGGFVLQSVSSDYLADDHLFTPARKEIVFNPALTHNDGLLTELYMQSHASNFSKACSLIKNDVAEMKNQLENNSELQFGSIGLIFKENERLFFKPDKRNDDLYSIQFYGLPFFNFLPLTSRNTLDINEFKNLELETKTEMEHKINPNSKQGKNVIYNIPVTRTFVQVITAAAAAVLLFLVLPTPVNDVNKASYTASFVPQEIMPKKSVNAIVADAFSMNHDGSNDIDGYVTEHKPITDEMVLESRSKTGSLDPETENPIVAKTTTPSTAAPPTAAASASSPPSVSASPSVVSTSGLKYYVIIGSFNTKTRAQTFINGLNSKEKTNAGIVAVDKYIRVYAQFFSSEKDASSYKEQLRQNPKHADAWIYKGP